MQTDHINRHATAVDRIHRLLLSVTDSDLRERPDGWSVREVVGHLIDSAGNNHQRVCRIVPGGNLSFPAYDQRTFVDRAGYDGFDWPTLVVAWYSFNLLLLHMFARIPEEMLSSSTVTVGDRAPVSYDRLIEDYYTHLEIHEEQVHRIAGI